MGRRKSRETALQILFQLEFNEDQERQLLDQFFNDQVKDKSDYAQKLVRGVASHKNEIDTLIQSYTKNWRISRMLCIDRNILRLAVYELLFEEDMAAAVAINEAVELAKTFGSTESAKFVNGILDSLSKDPKVEKKLRGNTHE
ncbi:MAG: transcription antitermination factor NusB [Candidatus Aminicenantes bacterium]|nr:transcription antitermination factor NusB [Candidatus Aminicenantes bacterium]